MAGQKKATPTSARHLDLDAAREARIAKMETDGTVPTVTLGGNVRKMAPELDLRAMMLEAVGDIRGLVEAMFPHDDADEILSAGLTVQDMRSIADELYGIDSGKEQASAT